jgi:hypothetical protein
MKGSGKLRSQKTDNMLQRPANVRKQEQQDEGEHSGSNAVEPESSGCGPGDDRGEGKGFADGLRGQRSYMHVFYQSTRTLF